ncbi:MAG: chemotaxis protein CheB, partial [Myxococcota bacterium]
SDGAWPFRPSIDALFLSLAEHHGRAAAGVVLSGMGNDGARGLAALSQAGGLALVQDEASAAVFGMPREAAASAPGARVLPLSALGGELARAAHD